MSILKLNKYCYLIFTSFLLAVSPGFSEMESGTEKEGDGSISWQKETVSATVNNINRTNNEVTLEDNDGNTFTVTLDKKVNISQINPGDKVNVELYRSIATDFHKPTPQELENPLIVTDETINAPEGTEPVAGELRKIIAVVEIVDIDKEDQIVTVKGPQGNEFELFVSDLSKLNNVKEDDSFTITYTEALAVSIEKIKEN